LVHSLTPLFDIPFAEGFSFGEEVLISCHFTKPYFCVSSDFFFGGWVVVVDVVGCFGWIFASFFTCLGVVGDEIVDFVAEDVVYACGAGDYAVICPVFVFGV
jgi:hypothetical protein